MSNKSNRVSKQNKLKNIDKNLKSRNNSINSNKIVEDDNKSLSTTYIDDSEYIDDDLNEEFYTDSFKDLTSKIKLHISDPRYANIETSKEIIIVPSKNRITSEYMTIFEYTRVLSERSKQIQNGSPIFIDLSDLIVDNKLIISEKKIAHLEIIQKKCPLIIQRMYNNVYGEEWSVNEMELPHNLIS
jgi:DNA-directed RNA polymerase subunit K/omega